MPFMLSDWLYGKSSKMRHGAVTVCNVTENIYLIVITIHPSVPFKKAP